MYVYQVSPEIVQILANTITVYSSFYLNETFFLKQMF